MCKISSAPEGAFSMLELMVTVGLIAIVLGIGTINMRKLDNPLITGSASFAAYLKQARAKAISSTSAYAISPSATNQLQAKRQNTCSSTTFTLDTKMKMKLPTGASFSETGWSICFNSRGFPSANNTVTMRDVQGATKRIEVMLGGSVRIL